jgi:hypothetical protein
MAVVESRIKSNCVACSGLMFALRPWMLAVLPSGITSNVGF